MAAEKILIAVKTYPSLSKKYDELVCTAGVRQDGSWIRLYPIPFRKMDYDKQYRKYEWIEADIVRNEKDFRPETFRVISFDSIKRTGEIPPDKDGTWVRRRDLLLKNVYYSKERLIEDAYNPEIYRSLAVFKPFKITGFIIKEAENREWDKETLQYIEAKLHQIDLFSGIPEIFKVVKKLPYNFYYEFMDSEGKKSTLQIIDWEIGALYWNCIKRFSGDEIKACECVKKKYWDDFALTKDVCLILGTTKEYHAKQAPNPFVIIGVFPPKFEQQLRLL